ncbi:hypothetical protein A5886_002385 [Enterococcus sp. 8G7_MSG3316]|uniref:Uncharacterized protein n=1 Tax=Candidatus Enterococcus testudinis TaxID=1834191 RepID=A0A242A8C8_9ENTE|nr:hypothetical protein A5886_002385 [Enterococcus sp. 8G7_MSG3316]
MAALFFFAKKLYLSILIEDRLKYSKIAGVSSYLTEPEVIP